MASTIRFRLVLWWQKLVKKDFAVAGVGLIIFFFVISFLIGFQDGNKQIIRSSELIPTSDLVELTLLRNARDRGAFCLDGSLPGYHFQKGFGSGTGNWVLHIEGGGWCNSVESCLFRRRTALGSSKYMDRQVRFSGILSIDPSLNPDFYNWNKVKIRYCDGASLAGHSESELKDGTKLFFRGQLIWEALMDELLSIGLSSAKEFTRSESGLHNGCSAGGLATLIHCDDFREIMPKNATVKCLADAGFFLDEKDVLGNRTMSSFYHDVVELQGATNLMGTRLHRRLICTILVARTRYCFLLEGVAKSLDKNCISRKEPSKCLFPQEILKSIETPVFIVNPAYDFWQIQNILVPVGSDPTGSWWKCKLNINSCNPSQVDILQGYRKSMLNALSGFHENNQGRGMFINSCFIHCQTWMAETWHSPNSPKIANKTIAEHVGEWYFNNKAVKQFDCPYPCNPTCHNMIFS